MSSGYMYLNVADIVGVYLPVKCMRDPSDFILRMLNIMIMDIDNLIFF